MVKLLGSGEYQVERPGESAPDHFGLAVQDYTHSTAPNRRYPDVITQRLLKAAIAGRPVPYGDEELEALARHCTEQEDNAAKVERQVRKSAAALLLEPMVGRQFADNPELDEALAGELVVHSGKVDAGRPRKSEHVHREA